MTVRQSLLAILAVGPCYGYQLRAEFDRRTGSTWPLNVGQTYTTLERLERDGLVRRGDEDADGHLYWQITEEGREAATAWLTDPVAPARGVRDELAVKIAIASTLPGVDADEVLRSQRRATEDRIAALTAASYVGPGGRGEQLAWSLLRDGRVMEAEAELRWLDHCAGVLAEERPEPLPLTTEKPRRGRPARAVVAD